jgi:hypothetical protein
MKSKIFSELIARAGYTSAATCRGTVVLIEREVRQAGGYSGEMLSLIKGIGIEIEGVPVFGLATEDALGFRRGIER